VQEQSEVTEVAPPAGERPDAESGFRHGDILAGRFVLYDRLGSGGSGTVFSALDTKVGDRVAVKILAAAAHDPANRERLRREIRATRSGHPNVVSIHELHDGDGLLFITMELVDGASLRIALEDRERLPLDDVVVIGRQIAAALDHLHAQGLVHRDVKPGNIMLAPTGAAKLCDMGLARPMAAGATVTETEMVVGTPAYMAPEMAREGELVAASDVYALGLTLYQCLTGEVPLARTTAVDTLMARQRNRARPVRALRPECPRWLNRLLDRMLDPEPDLRPTAAAVARALAEGGFGWRPHRRHLKGAAVAMGVALVGAALIAIGLRLFGAPPDPKSDPVANELRESVETWENGTTYNVVDGYGRTVTSFTSNVARSAEKARVFKTRNVGFADLDGDGRRDVVFANPDHETAEQLEIQRRLPDGSTERSAAWNLHFEVEYEGRRFGKFAPTDIDCADLSGDGKPEITIVSCSSPYYAAAVRVFTTDGAEVLRVLHPGMISNVRTGDRDNDGRAELYVGATNNFHEQNVGNESSPTFFVVEADWTKTGQVLDLFGPGRTMAETTPAGIEATYVAMAQQRLIPPLTPWRYAIVTGLSATGGDQFLAISTDRAEWKESTTLSYLRTFMFDTDLRLSDGLWVVGPLRERGIDLARAEPDALTVTYWNGSAWQPDVCAIPQAD
jgi:serine/threonine-protein kinase